MILASIFNHSFPLTFLYTTVMFFIPLWGSRFQFFGNSNRGIGLKATAIFTFFASLICIQSGDFFYYGIILQTNRGITHLEEFYRWLWSVIHHYILWRAIVWGAATTLFFLMVKRLPVNKKFACFIFIISQLFYWGTMRNMLGFCSLLTGVSLLYYPMRSRGVLVSYIFGIAFILACQFLHRSMYLYTFVTLIAFVPWGKKVIRLSYFAFPFLYTVVFLIAKYFLGNFGDEEFQDLGTRYVEMGTTGATFMQEVNTVIVYGCYTILMFKCLKYSYSHSIPSFFNFMLRYSYVLMYAGLLFYGQENAEWLSIRLMNASGLGLTLVFMYILYYIPRTRTVQLAFSGLIYFCLYNWLYMIYASRHAIHNLLRIEI